DPTPPIAANLFSAIVIIAIATTFSKRKIVNTPNFCYEYILDPIVFRPAVHYKNKDFDAEATTLMDTKNEFK
ncbi:MAG: hypothetical protein PVF32_18845, partial [Desulfobacterales bacterium]